MAQQKVLVPDQKSPLRQVVLDIFRQALDKRHGPGVVFCKGKRGVPVHGQQHVVVRGRRQRGLVK